MNDTNTTQAPQPYETLVPDAVYALPLGDLHEIVTPKRYFWPSTEAMVDRLVDAANADLSRPSTRLESALAEAPRKLVKIIADREPQLNYITNRLSMALSSGLTNPDKQTMIFEYALADEDRYKAIADTPVDQRLPKMEETLRTDEALRDGLGYRWIATVLAEDNMLQPDSDIIGGAFYAPAETHARKTPLPGDLIRRHVQNLSELYNTETAFERLIDTTEGVLDTHLAGVIGRESAYFAMSQQPRAPPHSNN